MTVTVNDRNVRRIVTDTADLIQARNANRNNQVRNHTPPPAYDTLHGRDNRTLRVDLSPVERGAAETPHIQDRTYVASTARRPSIRQAASEPRQRVDSQSTLEASKARRYQEMFLSAAGKAEETLRMTNDNVDTCDTAIIEGAIDQLDEIKKKLI